MVKFKKDYSEAEGFKYKKKTSEFVHIEISTVSIALKHSALHTSDLKSIWLRAGIEAPTRHDSEPLINIMIILCYSKRRWPR